MQPSPHWLKGLGQPAQGAKTEGGFEVPLNLYSDSDSRFVIVVELNQAVNPLESNLTEANIQLEFDADPSAGQDWQRIAIEIALVENCSSTGATRSCSPTSYSPLAPTSV